MRLLIADVVWRMRWKAAGFGVGLLVMFGASVAIGDTTRAFGLSMGLALVLGPQLIQSLVPRSIWYLPLSRREIWRAGWLVSTVGITLLTTAVKLAAMLVPDVRDSFGLASLTLSTLYDFTAAGLGCGLVILTTRPQPTSGPWRPVSTVMSALATLVLLSGVMLGLYGSAAVRDVVPTHWSDLTARSAAALVAALALATATYFHSPSPPMLSTFLFEHPSMKRRTRRIEPGRLSGLPRLLVHESAWTLMVGSALVAGSALFVFVAAKLAQAPEGLIGTIRAVLQRLDGRVTPEPGGGFDAVILLMAFAVFAASLAARFPMMMRHLRVLPLGAARLNALLLAWPAGVWLIAWTGLQALHYAILGQDVGFHHADALVGLIGVSAIVQAITLRLSGGLRILAFAPLLVLVPLLLFFTPPAAACVAAGIGGLAAAALLNRRSLARRSTYTLDGPAIGSVRMV